MTYLTIKRDAALAPPNVLCWYVDLSSVESMLLYCAVSFFVALCFNQISAATVLEQPNEVLSLASSANALSRMEEGLPREEIRLLPTRRPWWKSLLDRYVLKKKVKVDGDLTREVQACFICLDDVFFSETNARDENPVGLKVLPCHGDKHHRGCLKTWLQKNRLATCPTCREPIHIERDLEFLLRFGVIRFLIKPRYSFDGMALNFIDLLTIFLQIIVLVAIFVMYNGYLL